MPSFVYIVIISTIIFAIVYIYVDIMARKQKNEKRYIPTVQNTQQKIVDAPSPFKVDDGRRIDGHRLMNENDLMKWGIKKGLTEGYIDGMGQLLYDIRHNMDINPQTAMYEWFQRYEAYRKICLECGIWNMMIQDRTPFTGSYSQQRAQNELFENIRFECQEGKHQRFLYEQEQTQYKLFSDEMLRITPSKDDIPVRRSEVIKQISMNYDMSKSSVYKIYRRMLKQKLIAQEKNGDYYYVTKTGRRRPSKRRKRDIPQRKLTIIPSYYDDRMYSQVTQRTVYKAQNTVGIPFNVNDQNHTGQFVSLSRGTHYTTSLNECTCEAFTPGREPCKHMVALAMHFGMYKPQ